MRKIRPHRARLCPPFSEQGQSPGDAWQAWPKPLLREAAGLWAEGGGALVTQGWASSAAPSSLLVACMARGLWD